MKRLQNLFGNAVLAILVGLTLLLALAVGVLAIGAVFLAVGLYGLAGVATVAFFGFIAWRELAG